MIIREIRGFTCAVVWNVLTDDVDETRGTPAAQADPPSKLKSSGQAPRHWPNPPRARSPALQLSIPWSRGDLTAVFSSSKPKPRDRLTVYDKPRGIKPTGNKNQSCDSQQFRDCSDDAQE